MTSYEAYKRFLNKLTRNDTNSGIDIPEALFVVLFNNAIDTHVIQKIKESLDGEEIDTLKELLETDVELPQLDKDSRMVTFGLPGNYLKYAGSFTLAKRGACSNRVLSNRKMKPRDKDEILADALSSPSFDFEQTLVLLDSKGLQVYLGDFTVEAQHVSYWREPRKIDIAGYVRYDGQPSTTIDPDISDALVEFLINHCTEETERGNQNTGGLSLAKDRIATEL